MKCLRGHFLQSWCGSPSPPTHFFFFLLFKGVVYMLVLQNLCLIIFSWSLGSNGHHSLYYDWATLPLKKYNGDILRRNNVWSLEEFIRYPGHEISSKEGVSFISCPSQPKGISEQLTITLSYFHHNRHTRSYGGLRELWEIALREQLWQNVPDPRLPSCCMWMCEESNTFLQIRFHYS